MKTITLLLLMPILGFGQINLKTLKWYGANKTDTAINYTMIFKADTVTISNDSELVYRGHHSITWNGFDTIMSLETSSHGCKDSTPFVRNTLNFKFNDSLLNVTSIGFDDKCESLNKLLRSNFWFVGGFKMPEDTTEIVKPIDRPNSINENKVVGSFFPNPVNNFLTLDYSTANISLIDLSGNVLIEIIIKGKTEINLSEFDSGVYFLKVNNNWNRLVLY